MQVLLTWKRFLVHFLLCLTFHDTKQSLSYDPEAGEKNRKERKTLQTNTKANTEIKRQERKSFSGSLDSGNRSNEKPLSQMNKKESLISVTIQHLGARSQNCITFI